MKRKISGVLLAVLAAMSLSVNAWGDVISPGEALVQSGILPAVLVIGPVCAPRSKEDIAIELDVFFVNLIQVRLAKQIQKVLIRTPDYIGILQILQYGRHDVYRLVGMSLTEIRVIIEYRLPLLSILQKFADALAQDRIQGVIRPE